MQLVKRNAVTYVGDSWLPCAALAFIRRSPSRRHIVSMLLGYYSFLFSFLAFDSAFGKVMYAKRSVLNGAVPFPS